MIREAKRRGKQMKTKIQEATLPYKPDAGSKEGLKRCRDDFRIFSGWYATLKEKGEFKYKKSEILHKFLVPCLRELIREGSTEFHPETWKKWPKEIYLEAFDVMVKKFRYLVAPHAEMIYKREKTATVHSRNFIQGSFVSIVGPEYEFGFARFKNGIKINLKQFEELKTKHRVSEEERKKWWPDKKELYFYEIRTWIPLEKPRHVRVPKGVQTYGERARLNEEWKLDEARHRKDQCMRCNAKPEYDMLWAEGMGRCWFCEKHLQEWIGEQRADAKKTGYALDVDAIKKVDGGVVADKWADNRNANLKKNLNRIMKEQVQKQKINSPTFAYMTVYQALPKEFLRGRTEGPKKLWRGNDVDKALKDKWLESLNGIKGIEIRSSDAGKSPERIAFVVIRFEDVKNDPKAKNLSSKLAKEDGIFSKSDIGMEGRPRICVAGRIWEGQNGWEDWWESVAGKIEKCVGRILKEGLKEQAFNPEDYEPTKLEDMDQYGLLKTEKNLAAIFEERGARENDELVINAYQFVKSELRRRGVEVEFHKVLDRLTASEEKGRVRKFLMQGIKKIQELGPIIWKPKFISLTGSSLFVDDKGKREPNDLDTVFRDEEINTALLLKIDRIFEKYFGVSSHPIAEPFGPNWRNLPVWDLALIPRKDVTVEEIDEPGFVKEFYEATETGVQAEARKSAAEDEIKMGRYFFGMKPTKGYLREEKMSVNGLMKFIDEGDYPILVEKKYDGVKLIVFKDAREKAVTIYTDDGGNVTNRLPKSIAAIKKLNVKTAIFEVEAELWRDGKHMPREMMAGYLHEKGEPNDDDVMMNAYGILYKDGADIHKEEEEKRRAVLEGIDFGQSTNDKPNMKLQLNRVKSVVVKNAKEFRTAVEDLRRRAGSEGVVVKKSKARYYLNRNSKGGWYKLHNTEMIAGIVIERIGTKTAGVYTYRYGIDPGKYKVRPGDLGEVKDKEYMEVGTSFSTNKKVDRGEIIEIEFSTLNFIKDERSGTVQVTAWVPRFMRELKDKTEPDGVDVVVGRARKEGILREKRVTKARGVLYESKSDIAEVEYMSKEEYRELVDKEFGIESGVFFRSEAFLESIEEIYENVTEGSSGVDVAYRALIKKAEVAAKKLPKYWAVIENHYRTRSQHKDFRVKMNDHLEGKTITDQPEGEITEDIKTVEQGRKWQEQIKYKFRPDMDPDKHVVVVKKSKQPIIWMKFHDKFMGKYAAAPPGSVTATRFGWGVVVLEDEGFAYPTIKKPFFEEFFLNMKKYKGRMVFRLIPVGVKWEKPPKGKLQWQCWLTKDQIPYLLSRRARVKKDYIPDPERTTASGLPPDWEKKIPIALRWWGRKLSRSEKLTKMDEAYNYLIEKKVLKGHKLKESDSKKVKFIVRRNWYRGQLVVRGMPVQHWELVVDSGKNYLDEFRLESDPLIKEKLERGIPAIHRKITGKTPKGEGFREWMKFEGEIPPNHPEWGNPNKKIPAYKKIIDKGLANWIEESEMFHSFEFNGKGLSGAVVIIRESPDVNIWVMKRGKKPGEEI